MTTVVLVCAENDLVHYGPRSELGGISTWLALALDIDDDSAQPGRGSVKDLLRVILDQP